MRTKTIICTVQIFLRWNTVENI